MLQVTAMKIMKEQVLNFLILLNFLMKSITIVYYTLCMAVSHRDRNCQIHKFDQLESILTSA